MIILISLVAFVATFLGGLLAIRFKDRLHLILGFSAGAVLGVAFFDLIPESIELGVKFYSPDKILVFTAIGFFVYLLLDRIIFFHGHSHDHEEHSPHQGTLGAGSLVIHSFLDGVAIGLAFQVSPEIGAVVTAAVLVHDFSDGINTVNMIFRHNGENKIAYKWLIIDALAPVLGAASTFLFSLPENILTLVLSLFSGFFLYIGASDLIPESHHGHPKFLTTCMTFFGAIILYIVIQIAHF